MADVITDPMIQIPNEKYIALMDAVDQAYYRTVVLDRYMQEYLLHHSDRMPMR
jgi:hypothetical protein